MTIEITNESGVEVDETVLLRLTEHNLAELHVSADADIAILLVDEGAMEALHVQWMDEPGPTDVLSFPMDELRPGTEDRPTAPGLLGDIVLCPTVTAAQAAENGRTPESEADYLLVHGTLHLLGYDHEARASKTSMWTAQQKALAELDLLMPSTARPETQPRR